jgi:hypothetical protein
VDLDFDMLASAMGGAPSEAIDDVGVEKKVRKVLKKYSAVKVAAIFSALMLTPKYQSSSIRLEYALRLSLKYCKGTLSPTSKVIKDVIDFVSNSPMALNEDPAEDVFSSPIWFEGKPYEIPLGMWEGAVFYTQTFIKLVEVMPDQALFNELRDEIRALLTITHRILRRNKIPCNEVIGGDKVRLFERKDYSNVFSLLEKVKVSDEVELSSLPILEQEDLDSIKSNPLERSVLDKIIFGAVKGNVYLINPLNITVFIRERIFSFCKDNSYIDKLSSMLAQLQMDVLLTRKLFNEFSVGNVPVSKCGSNDWYQAAFSVDYDIKSGYDFIFLFDGVTDLDSSGFHNHSVHSQKQLEIVLAHNSKYLERDSDVANRVLVLVICTYGRRLFIPSKSDFKKYSNFISLPAHDFHTLNGDNEVKPTIILRLVEFESKARKEKVNIFNMNGFINLYSWVKGNGFSLIPYDHLNSIDSLESEVLIAIPSNCQCALRELSLKNYHEMLVNHPIDGDVRVVKAYRDGYFGSEDRDNLYCPSVINKNKFQLVLSNSFFCVWIEMERLETEPFDLQFKIFDAAARWLESTLNVLLEAGLDVSAINLWKLDFEFPEQRTVLDKGISIDDVYDACKVIFSNGVVSTFYKEAVLQSISSKVNVCEKSIVSAFIEGVALGDKYKARDLTSRVIKDDFARHIHGFTASKYVHYIDVDLDNDEPISILEIDHQMMKFDMMLDMNVEGGKIIEGKSECSQFLKDTIDYLWESISNRLSGFDRESLLIMIFNNLEKAEFQKDRWNNSYKANLSLNNKLDVVKEVAAKKISEFNGSSLGSRILVEMALCICSERGGLTATEQDLQELLCWAISLHQFGGVSEAITYDAIESKIVHTGLGDVRFDHSFYDQVVSKYYIENQNDALTISADNYDKNYEEVSPVSSVVGELESDFLQAWLMESGFGVDEMRFFIDAVEDYGIKRNELVFTMTTDEFKGLNLGGDVMKVLEFFSLVYRNSPKLIPEGFNSNDWQPWRFRRRYSSASMPIARISDDIYIVSPQHIRRACFYFLQSCYHASFDMNGFVSKEMKTWIQSKRDSSSKAFNNKVAKLLIDNGWQVREEIKISEILNKKVSDLGDVDVFAWNKALNIVIAIECKDLLFAKSQGEIAKLLHEFKGVINRKRKKDLLLKHVVRVQTLETDVPGLERFTSCVRPKLIGAVVFSNKVPMKFLDSNCNYPDIHRISVDDIDILLA